MKDTDLGWLRRRLPLCHCGAEPRKLDNDFPTILYFDLNDDGTFYVRWFCDNMHTIAGYSIDLIHPNAQIKPEPIIPGIMMGVVG